MLCESRRRSMKDRLTSPLGCAASHGKNWSALPLSSVALTGAVQVAPPSCDTDKLTSELLQGGTGPSFGSCLQEPFGKSVQATKIEPSGVMAAVGKPLALRPRSATIPNCLSAFFR